MLIGGAWACFAPLDSASTAQGTVVSSSKKRVIQQQEGGKLIALNVKEGDFVEKGQVLAQMDDSIQKNRVKAYQERLSISRKSLEAAHETARSREQLCENGYSSRHELLHAQRLESEQKERVVGLEAELRDATESLERRTIKSPIQGRVTQLDVSSTEAILHPGSSLMTITPTEDELIIEAFVRADDIEAVKPGLKAKVKISSFRHRSVGALHGKVVFVSHDAVDAPAGGGGVSSRLSVDSRFVHSAAQSGQTFYKVRVSVDKEELKSISKYRTYELMAGMPASVFIVTGERTLVQYLLDPILTSFWHAFNEK